MNFYATTYSIFIVFALIQSFTAHAKGIDQWDPYALDALDTNMESYEDSDYKSNPPKENHKTSKKTWYVTITANLSFLPDYPGSTSYRPYPYPTMSFSFDNPNRYFSAGDDGFSFPLYETQFSQFLPIRFSLGPTLSYISGRKRGSKHPELKGINNAHFALEPGLYTEIMFDERLRTRLEVRNGIIGHYGFRTSLSLDWLTYFDRLLFAIGPRVNYGDRKFAQTYFGITEQESQANGFYPSFSPKYTLEAGLQTSTRYTFNAQWSATAYGGYTRLIGSSSHSPLVLSSYNRFGTKNNFLLGISVDYSFTMPALF